MNATLTDRPQKFTTKHRRETPCYFAQWSAGDLDAEPWPDGTLPELVTLRTYATPRGSTVTAALWTQSADRSEHRSGTGSAGGGGYHKASAAAHEAIRNAGIDLSERIDGRGESAIASAVLAIARALGAKRPALITAKP